MNRTAKFLSYLAFAVFIFALDQYLKSVAFGGGFEFLNSLKPVFSKQLFGNDQFAFSIPLPELVIYLIYLALLSSLIYWFVKTPNKSFRVCLGFTLILVGALSNIYDRVTLGYVRDFIYIFWGNIFNPADVYIVLGIILMLL